MTKTGQCEADAAAPAEGGAAGRFPGDLGLIAEVVGSEAAMKIAYAFKGTTLYIPGIESRGERDDRIRGEYEKGATIKALAARHGLTERTIRSVLKHCRPAR